jgi:ubiquinone/menaquinone biosynthesis C-methylase UbiE
MGLIARYVWAPILDYLMRQEPVMRQREKIVPLAAGRILEVGVGSGLNLPLYDAGRVERVCGLDPAVELQGRSRTRAAAGCVPVQLFTGSAEEIPFADGSFDAVLTTFTLCSIPDVGRALGEMRRVLKPSGRLLFAEHGLSDDAGVARWQNRLNPAWLLISRGCNMNRPIASLLRGGGFAIDRVETLYLPGPRVLSYHYWGTAVPA